MGISNSLYTGWTGLATHQKSLDNTGNNIANINTTGFRRREFMFGELFSQIISGSMPAGTTRSTTNPVGVGPGVTTASIAPTFQQGPMEPTGNNLDVAINGNGFFLVSDPQGLALTRNGSFYLDHTLDPNRRLLCSGDGLRVQGWQGVDGVITPSTTISDILLPAIGDLLPGRVTTNLNLSGVLPSNNTGVEFSGNPTREMDLKGNLAVGADNRIRTSISVPVTTLLDGVPVASDQYQEIPVEIVFTGPVAGSSERETWSWQMNTVDWPNPGDPAQTIYPPPGVSSTSYPAQFVRFYNQSDTLLNHGAGQAAEPVVINPGSSKVSVDMTLPTGERLQSSFDMYSGLAFDVSRLTSLAGSPPGAGQLEAWYVDGNPVGSMTRSVITYEEVTRFVPVADANGNSVMTPERRVEARYSALWFSKTASTNTDSTWEWHTANGPAGGSLTFNTIGDLVASSGSGGRIAFDFQNLQSINYAADVVVAAQDGYVDGFLQDITIDQYGRIFGHYSNNVAEPLAQLALGTVPNLTGLAGVGGTLFYTSSSSGEIMIGAAGDKDGAIYPGLVAIGAGLLTSGYLEGSNSDLSVEFGNLITTERAYQASSRIVSTSNELLQTLIAMKR